MSRTTCIISAALLLAFAGCARRPVLRPSPLMVEADSLYSAGEFDSAAARYAEARDSLGGTPGGARAQYSLAYLNVFSGNPKVAWNRALQEFKLFVVKYAEHPLVGQAKTWIRALVTMDALRQQDQSKTTKLKELIAKRSPAEHPLDNTDYDILLESVQQSYEEYDSLAAKVKLLEEVIETIEKTP